MYTGIVLTPVVYWAFACRYTGRGRWLRRRTLALVLIEPAITSALVWTNQVHELMFRNVRLSADGPFLALHSDFGPWFWIHAWYCYGFLATGSVLMAGSFLWSRRVYRAQSGAVLLSVLAPWVANALYIFGYSPLPELDLTPLTFTFTGIAIGWGMFRFRFLDVEPVVRGTMFEGMSDAVIIVDGRRHIVDLNTRAEELIGFNVEDVVAKPLAAVLPLALPAGEKLIGGEHTAVEATLGEGDARRYFDLRGSPVHPDRGPASGMLLVLRDVTERRRAEHRLEESEQRYRSLFDHNLDAAFAADTRGRVTSANAAAVRTFGYSEDEMIGHRFLMLVIPEDRWRTWSHFRRATRGEAEL
jgi:PAS domain S-box-containing protein